MTETLEEVKTCPVCTHREATDNCGTHTGFIDVCESYDCKLIVFNHGAALIKEKAAEREEMLNTARKRK
jgi:hypothetical protein